MQIFEECDTQAAQQLSHIHVFLKNSVELLFCGLVFQVVTGSCGSYIIVNQLAITPVVCPQGTAGPPQHHVLPGVPGAHVRGYRAGSGLEALLHTQQPHGGNKIHRWLTWPSEAAG